MCNQQLGKVPEVVFWVSFSPHSARAYPVPKGFSPRLHTHAGHCIVRQMYHINGYGRLPTNELLTMQSSPWFSHMVAGFLGAPSAPPSGCSSLSAALRTLWELHDVDIRLQGQKSHSTSGISATSLHYGWNVDLHSSCSADDERSAAVGVLCKALVVTSQACSLHAVPEDLVEAVHRAQVSRIWPDASRCSAVRLAAPLVALPARTARHVLTCRYRSPDLTIGSLCGMHYTIGTVNICLAGCRGSRLMRCRYRKWRCALHCCECSAACPATARNCVMQQTFA